MIKRQRALSSQIGHDLPRDLTLIAREVIAADNIGPAEQCLFAFATLVRSCGKDFGVRLIVGAAAATDPGDNPRVGDVAALSRTKHGAQTA